MIWNQIQRSYSHQPLKKEDNLCIEYIYNLYNNYLKKNVLLSKS